MSVHDKRDCVGAKRGAYVDVLALSNSGYRPPSRGQWSCLLRSSIENQIALAGGLITPTNASVTFFYGTASRPILLQMQSRHGRSARICEVVSKFCSQFHANFRKRKENT